MRVLIIGADGMLGYSIWRYFNAFSSHEAIASTRSDRLWSTFAKAPKGGLYRSGSLEDEGTVSALFAATSPDIIVNCSGVTKHTELGNDPVAVVRGNCLVPHLISQAAGNAGARMIQISTDCVFLGSRGNYSENDPADAEDLYGRSKWLGEIHDQGHVLTVRTSPLGFEIASRRGLLEWFLSQQGECRGFRNAFFSGLTALELAKIIDQVILPDVSISGLFHIPGPRIDKFSLLNLFSKHFNHSIEVRPFDEFVIDRSLDGKRFVERTGYRVPDWDSMLSNLAAMGR